SSRRGARPGVRHHSLAHHDAADVDVDEDSILQDAYAGVWSDEKQQQHQQMQNQDSNNPMAYGAKGGDWTVTVTQTVTQRLLTVGASQIVVEVPPSGLPGAMGGRFPLGLEEAGMMGVG